MGRGQAVMGHFRDGTLKERSALGSGEEEADSPPGWLSGGRFESCLLSRLNEQKTKKEECCVCIVETQMPVHVSVECVVGLGGCVIGRGGCVVGWGGCVVGRGGCVGGVVGCGGCVVSRGGCVVII